MMVNVAIAGGSRSIGSAIVAALHADGSHKYVILSRTESDDPEVVTVDYSDIENLAETLDAHEIHTVISALSLQSDASGRAQMNLIEAAIQAHHTKRFMPSEFGANYTQKFIKGLPLYAWKLKAADLLEESNLEYTRISNGIFLDYWFSPHIKSAFAVNVPTWVDVENNYAVIPGDGNTPLVVTHSRDIARFVVAVLGLLRWEKQYFLAGDRLTINDFVRLAEEVKGVEFEKHTNDADTLAQGGCTFVPAARGLLQALEDEDQLSMGRMLAFIGTLIVDGDMDLPAEPNLNKVFPHLKVLTVREALEISFGKGG